jgi:hypothetical protein
MASRAVVVTTWPVGPVREGGARRLVSLCSALAEQDVDVTIVALGASGHGVRWSRLARGVRQVTVARSGAHAAADERVARELGEPCPDFVAADTVRLTPRFGELLRDALVGADIVVANGPWLVLSLDGCWDGPLVYDAAGTTLGGSPSTAVDEVLRTLERRALARAAFALAVSAEEAQILLGRGPLAADAIVVAPQLVDPAQFREPERAARRVKRRVFSAAFTAACFGGAATDAVQTAERVVALAAELVAVRFVVGGAAAGALAGRAVPANVAIVDEGAEETYRWMLGTVDVVLLPPAGAADVLLDAVAGGAAIVAAPAALRGTPELQSLVELAEPSGWAEAIRRVAALPDAEVEARVRETQRVVAITHARQPFVAEMLARTGVAVRANVRKPSLSARTALRAVVAAPGDAARPVARYSLAATSTLEVVICSRGSAGEVGQEIVVAPHAIKRRIPRTPVEREGEDAALEEASWLNPALADGLAYALRRASIAVAVGPYAHGALRSAWSGPLVYDAPRVEYAHAVAGRAAGRAGAQRLQRVAELERACARDATAVFAACAEDAELLLQLYGLDRARVSVVPPGLAGAPPYAGHAARAQAKTGSTLAGRTVAVFVAADAADVLGVTRLEPIASALPEVLFVVVGAIPSQARAALGPQRPENIQFTGPADEASYRTLLAVADLAVHPVERESGVSYAVADYVGAGLPLVSTRRGARGWNIVDRDEAHVAELAAFPRRIREVLADPARSEVAALRLRLRLSDENGGTLAARLTQALEQFTPGLVSA